MKTTQDSKPHINVDYFEDLTGEMPDSGSRQVQEIGNRIKRLRQEKGISLEELSAATGFDIQFLENMEQGASQPQLGTLMKLSKALDGAFSRLVSGEGSTQCSITRKGSRMHIERSTTPKGQKQLYTYQSLAPEVRGRHMEALIVNLEENPDEETSMHNGEEFIYVLEGQVLFKFGDDRFELEPGDSAYYLSTTPHLVAAKTGKAQILAVLYEQ